MLPLIGALIGAGSSLIGGAMNRSATNKANQQNYEAQKEFAQNGLRWKIADGNAAGLHPLVSAGAQAQSFSPAFVGDQSMGQSMANAGQDIGRAVASTQTASERGQSTAMAALSLERAQLENDLLRTQIRRQVVETGPSFPTVGSSPDGLMFHGMNWETNPKTSSTQEIEDRYGDLLGAIYGVGVAASDASHNASGSGPSGKSGGYYEWAAKQRLASQLRGDPLQFLWDAANPPRDPYAGIFR